MSEGIPEVDENRVFLGLGDYVFELVVPEDRTPDQIREVLRIKLSQMERDLRVKIAAFIRDQITEDETADANRALGKVAYLVEEFEMRRDM